MEDLTCGWDNITQVAAHGPDSSKQFLEELQPDPLQLSRPTQSAGQLVLSSPPRKRRWEGSGRSFGGARSSPNCSRTQVRVPPEIGVCCSHVNDIPAGLQ